MYSASRIPAGTFTSDGILATELGVQGQRAERGRGIERRGTGCQIQTNFAVTPPSTGLQQRQDKERNTKMDRRGRAVHEGGASRLERETRRRSLAMLTLLPLIVIPEVWRASLYAAATRPDGLTNGRTEIQ